MAKVPHRGEFNKRVTIQFATKTKDQSAGHDATYPTDIETWTHVVNRGGVNVFTDGKLTEADEKDFYITWRSALSAVNDSTKFVFDGREYKTQKPGEFIDNGKHIIKYTTVGV